MGAMTGMVCHTPKTSSGRLFNWAFMTWNMIVIGKKMCFAICFACFNPAITMASSELYCKFGFNSHTSQKDRFGYCRHGGNYSQRLAGVYCTIDRLRKLVDGGKQLGWISQICSRCWSSWVPCWREIWFVRGRDSDRRARQVPSFAGDVVLWRRTGCLVVQLWSQGSGGYILEGLSFVRIFRPTANCFFPCVSVIAALSKTSKVWPSVPPPLSV